MREISVEYQLAFPGYTHGNRSLTVIRTHNHNRAFSLINLIRIVCVPMTRIVAFTVYERFEQVYEM